jgi:hypothetical protein
VGLAEFASKSRSAGEPKGAWHLVGLAEFASKSRSAGESKGPWHLVGVAGIASKSRFAGEPKGPWHLAEGCMVALVSLVAVLGKKVGGFWREGCLLASLGVPFDRLCDAWTPGL